MKSRRWLGALVVLALGALVAGGSLAQYIDPKVDPRNDKYWEAIDATCIGHHLGEMNDAFFMVLRTNYAEVPTGEPFTFTMEIRDANPTTFPLQLYDIGGTLDLGNATNLAFVTEGRDPYTPPPEAISLTPDPNQGDASRIRLVDFPIEANVTEVRLVLQGGPGALDNVPSPTGRGDVWDLAVYPFKNQGARVEAPSGDPFTKVIRISDQLDIYSRGLGTWQAEVRYDGNGPSADATLAVEVYYNTTAQTKQTVSSPEVIRDEEKAQLTWTMTGGDPGRAVLDFTFFARAHFDHPPGTNAQNDGRFLRFYRHTLDVGSGLRFHEVGAGSGVGAPQPVASVNLYNLVGRITGFVAAIVVPVGMVTGGVLGKGSRKSVNALTGGAKKRVLWHASMSFLIMAIAAVHLVLMLLEPQFKWTKGFLWGMGGLVFMGTLGVTGYYQVRIIKRWNYRTWRFMHLSAGVLVFLATIMHTVADGSDFGFLREDVPTLNRFIWP